MREFFAALWQDESGQDLAEYAMLLGLIALVVVGAVIAVGEELGRVFNSVGEKLEEVPDAGST